MATEIRKAGDFCWINILTPEPAGAMEFFAKLFGWAYYEMPGIGHGMQLDGRNIGGIFDIKTAPTEMSPMIGVVVKVDDADASCEKVRSLGGKADPAFDIGVQGRMAVCHDPNGAQFDIWEPKAMPGSDVDRSLHGAPSWSESLTTDVGRATEFYCGLFGWSAEVKQMPGMDYTVYKNGASDIAGMMSIPPDMGTPHWKTYFSVDDADEAARVAKELGGKIWVPPMDIPGIGRFCGIRSPQGVTFYAIKYLPRQGSSATT